MLVNHLHTLQELLWVVSTPVKTLHKQRPTLNNTILCANEYVWERESVYFGSVSVMWTFTLPLGVYVNERERMVILRCLWVCLTCVDSIKVDIHLLWLVNWMSGRTVVWGWSRAGRNHAPRWQLELTALFRSWTAEVPSTAEWILERNHSSAAPSREWTTHQCKTRPTLEKHKEHGRIRVNFCIVTLF